MKVSHGGCLTDVERELSFGAQCCCRSERTTRTNRNEQNQPIHDTTIMIPAGHAQQKEQKNTPPCHW